MTEVRIRHEYEVTGANLTSVPFDKLDDVIPTLKAWGIGGDYEDGELSGSFQYYATTNEAFFEVIIHADR